MRILQEYITLILKDIIIFPNQELKIEFNNLLSKEIISQSIVKYNKEILIATPNEEHGIDNIGVLCTINKFLILPFLEIKSNFYKYVISVSEKILAQPIFLRM